MNFDYTILNKLLDELKNNKCFSFRTRCQVKMLDILFCYIYTEFARQEKILDVKQKHLTNTLGCSMMLQVT